MADVHNESDILQTSKVHQWHGYAAQNRPASGITLEVTIPELTPALTGQLQTTSATQQIQLQDYSGNPINNSVTTKNTHTCYYKGGDTNRRYPPDVVAGEQVIVTRFANSDRYYWESAGRDDNLRMKETHRIDVANRTNPTDPNDDAHSYSFELDSAVNQHIRLQTSTGGGEKNTYTLILDGKNGQVRLSDDAGNMFSINTDGAKVIMRNAQNAFFMLNGQDAMWMAPGNITMRAGKQIIMTAPEISGIATDVIALVCKAFGLTAASSAVTQSPAIGLNGAVKIPNQLAVGQLRAGSISNGPVGSAYTVPSINVGTGAGTDPGNTPDTAAGTSQRYAAAWDQITTAMATITSCFDDVNAKIGVPTAQSSIASVITQSKMSDIQGT